MSAVASFYLIQNTDIPVIQDLAKLPVGPVKRKVLWFAFNTKQWHDPYWEFLATRARELEQFAWSGYVLTSEVYLFLDSRSLNMETFADKELSDHLSEARGDFELAFRREGAARFVTALDRIQPDAAVIDAFLSLDDMQPPDGARTPVEAVLDGFAMLRSWLSQVDDEHVGLLIIG